MSDIAVVYISFGTHLSRDEVVAKIISSSPHDSDDGVVWTDDLILDLVNRYNYQACALAGGRKGMLYPFVIKLQEGRFATTGNYATMGVVVAEFNFDDVEQAETASITTADLVQWMFESGKLADCYGNELDYVMKNSSSIELAIGRKPKMVIAVGI
jgi:hypothetical protein